MLLWTPQHNPSYSQGYATRSQSEAPGLWKGCVGAWVPSLGPTGLTLFDQSGFHFDGTLTNMDPATDWVIGEKLPGYMLDFTTKDTEKVDCGVPANFGGHTGMTATVWATAADDAPAAAGMFSQRDGIGTEGWQIWRLSGAYHGRVYNNSGANKSVTLGTWPTGKQLFIALRWQSGEPVQLFVDGVLLGDSGDVLTGTTRQATSTVTIGRSLSDSNAWDGQVGDSSLYARALSPAEIQQLYAKPLDMFRPRSRMFPTAVAAPPGFTSRNIIVGGGVI